MRNNHAHGYEIARNIKYLMNKRCPWQTGNDLRHFNVQENSRKVIYLMIYT